MHLPIHIAFFEYQYAKLRMLEFYYDLVAKYADRSDFHYCEMDTDSAYIALSEPSLEAVVKPNLRAQFDEEKAKWFPREDTPENTAYDKRTPGLFKIETTADCFIGLSSKTYYCGGDKVKFSCKGVNKHGNDITKETYLSVLNTGKSVSKENRGLRVDGHDMYGYTQTKCAFSYFYGKRKVLEDRVTTLPLAI